VVDEGGGVVGVGTGVCSFGRLKMMALRAAPAPADAAATMANVVFDIALAISRELERRNRRQELAWDSDDHVDRIMWFHPGLCRVPGELLQAARAWRMAF
jgi:hypothetical protein